ncbi:UNVERIFIED_CONTAM: hypothetical protein Sradi_2240000 [Sesamum radiatum]|uniref:Uncharacterized protein n=1 Tax=Sesamum radiatum TaxID=300843 RepID=A0AAW2T341_SESRA
MDVPSNTANKQKVVGTPDNTQTLQVVTGASLAPTSGGSAPTPLAPAPTPPGAVGPVVNTPRRSMSSDTSSEDLSPALLGAIQWINPTAIREQVVALIPAHKATSSDVDALDEEAEECVLVPASPSAAL